jgi:rhodanese-related sulfurtransferase
VEAKGPSTVAELLDTARAQLDRLTPTEAHARAANGAVIVDIRPVEQRRRDGMVPGARVVQRNVLEWRLDPECPNRDPELARRDRPVIVLCDEGYQSSLAAAELRAFGLDATDIAGGMQEWVRQGLPTMPASV